jgi:hypothetical protein
MKRANNQGPTGYFSSAGFWNYKRFNVVSVTVHWYLYHGYEIVIEPYLR